MWTDLHWRMRQLLSLCRPRGPDCDKQCCGIAAAELEVREAPSRRKRCTKRRPGRPPRELPRRPLADGIRSPTASGACDARNKRAGIAAGTERASTRAEGGEFPRARCGHEDGRSLRSRLEAAVATNAVVAIFGSRAFARVSSILCARVLPDVCVISRCYFSRGRSTCTISTKRRINSGPLGLSSSGRAQDRHKPASDGLLAIQVRAPAFTPFPGRTPAGRR